MVELMTFHRIIMKNKIWKRTLSRIWGVGEKKGHRLPVVCPQISPPSVPGRGQGLPSVTSTPFPFLPASGPPVIPPPSDSALREAPSKHVGTEVPVTKECFLFQMNLHILIEGRCLELIQCSKLGLSIYYAQRNKILRAQWGR